MSKTFIEKYKILPRKTYDINFEFPFETLSKEYYGDFICGFIDGDGSIENNKRGTCTIRISGTNINFYKQLEQILKELIGEISFTYKKCKGITIDYYMVTFNFKRKNKPDKVLSLYNLLYRQNRFCYLRKKEKLECYLKYLGKL